MYWLSGGPTNYGINKAIHEYEVAPTTVVLLDFAELIADPASENDQKLVRLLNDTHSARHLGGINVLFADGSIRKLGPSQLYPQFYRHKWLPD